MLRGLKEMLFGTPVKRVEEWSHDRLGTLRFDDDVGCWRAALDAQGRRIGFLIAGKDQPDPALLQHAVDVLDDVGNFRARVAAFLQDEANRQPHFASEIAQLQIEDLNLFWPNRPNDGMIYFSGPDEFRVWRCDYVNRTPKDLGFDS